MFRFILIAALIPAILGLVVHQCAVGPPANFVHVSGCGIMPCIVMRGEYLSLKMDFTTINEVTELREILRYHIFGSIYDIELPEDQANACLRLEASSSCPLSANENATYFMDKLISLIAPPVDIVAEVSLVDHNNEVVSCFKFDAIII